jgi:hypothetical protein
MLDGLNKLGGYSDPAAVFTKQYPVALPLSPAAGAKLDQEPTFVWTAGDGVTPYVFGAASYKLEVSQKDTFTPLYDSVKTDNTRYSPTKTYEIGRTYYWRVAIVDKDGNVGPFSDAWIIVDPIGGKDKFGAPIKATTLVNISDTMQLKEEMFMCHASQRSWLKTHHGIDDYVHSSLKELSARRGNEIGVAFAEGFRQHLGHAFPQDNILQKELEGLVYTT